MRARTSSVNDKITYAAEMQSVLRQLLTEVGHAAMFFQTNPNRSASQTSAHRMELIIIILIAVEVVIVSELHASKTDKFLTVRSV